MPFGARGITAAVEPFDGEVVGVETRNAAVCEVVDGAAPEAVALPLVSATEMEMGELDVFAKERIGQSARGWTGSGAGFPGEMAGDERGEFGREIALLRIAGDQDKFKVLAEAAQQFLDEHFSAALLHQGIFESDGDLHVCKLPPSLAG